MELPVVLSIYYMYRPLGLFLSSNIMIALFKLDESKFVAKPVYILVLSPNLILFPNWLASKSYTL